MSAYFAQNDDSSQSPPQSDWNSPNEKAMDGHNRSSDMAIVQCYTFDEGAIQVPLRLYRRFHIGTMKVR